MDAGPGDKLLAAIHESLGEQRIIAEDLGVVTAPVRRLQQRSGYPGMKVLSFAFDSGSGNPYLPHCYEKNSVVYAGTLITRRWWGFLDGCPVKLWLSPGIT